MPFRRSVLTGPMLWLGGVGILLGIYPVVVIIMLAAFVLPTSFMTHSFWKAQDPQMKMNEMINFMKNMALLGTLAMSLAIPGPWPLNTQAR